MKILIVTNSLVETNGVARYSAGLVGALTKAGHTIACIVQTASSVPTTPEFPVLEWPLRYLANPFRVQKLAREIENRVREFQPDIIHFLVEPYAFTVGFFPQSYVPTCMTVHGTYAYIPHLFPPSLKKFFSKLLTTRLYNRIDAVISVSTYTKQFLLKQVTEPLRNQLGKKTTVIGNSIELLPARRVTLVPTSTPASITPARVLFVGGVKERKGVLEALDVIHAYRTMYSVEVNFRIIGSLTNEPWYVEKVRAQIHKLNLNDCVELLGSVTEEVLQEEYRAADVFLMLSLGEGKEFEGFGLVYLEANAHAVPVIGAYGTGAEEAIQDGVSGSLVHADKPREGAEALFRILQEREHYGDGAYAWAKAHQWDHMVHAYEAVYHSIIKRV